MPYIWYPIFDMHLLRPLWLIAIIPLFWMLWRFNRSRGAGSTWDKLVDPHLLPHVLVIPTIAKNSITLPIWLIGIVGTVGIIALAGPVWQRLPQPTYRAQQHLVIVLDISPTMNATDLVPSRLARARFKILDLLANTKEGQVAMLAYGAEPFLVSPLTADAATIVQQIPHLKNSILPVQGPRRPDLALLEAGKLLQQVASTEGRILLITDGLDYVTATEYAAVKLQKAGYRISVLGVGTQQGAPVPLEDGGFLQDNSGAILLPKLQIQELQTLAASGGGYYATISADSKDLDILLPPMQSVNIDHSKLQETKADQWREEGPTLLLLLLPIAALAFRRGWMGPLLLLILVSPQSVKAFTWQDLWLNADQQAQRELTRGNPQQAAPQFTDPKWRAAAQYQAGNYNAVLENIGKLADAESKYNAGNALAHLGKYQEALDAYTQALAANPQDQDAKANQELMRRLIQQQQRQQQSQQQNNQQPQDASKNQQQDGQQSQDASNGQQNNHKSQPSAKTQPHPESQSESTTDADSNTGQNAKPEPQPAQNMASEQNNPKDGAGAPTQNPQHQLNTDLQPQPNKNTTDPDASKPHQDDNNQQTGLHTDNSQTAPKESAQDAHSNSQHAAMTPQQRADRESQRAMELLLSQVPDDPAGLLRQKFILQHMRRNN